MTAAEVAEAFEVRWNGGELLPPMNGHSTLTVACQQKRQTHPLNPYIVRRPKVRSRRAAISERRQQRIHTLLAAKISVSVIAAILHMRTTVVARLAHSYQRAGVAVRAEEKAPEPIARGAQPTPEGKGRGASACSGASVLRWHTEGKDL